MSRISHLALAALSIGAFTIATPAMAQSTPSPTPTPTPTPTPPPGGGIIPPTGGPPCIGDNCPTYGQRRPNADYFEREFNLRQMEAAMGTPENRVRTWQHSQILAKCLYAKGGENTYQLVGGKPVEDEKYMRLAKALDRDYRSCVTPEAKTLPREIANAALMELLVLEGGADMVRGLGNVPPKQAQLFIAGDGKVDVDAIGRCVAVLAPRPAARLLQSEAGSDEERSALENLYASAPACGLKEPPEDVKPIFQRSAVAGGLYYWSVHKIGTVTVGEES